MRGWEVSETSAAGPRLPVRYVCFDCEYLRMTGRDADTKKRRKSTRKRHRHDHLVDGASNTVGTPDRPAFAVLRLMTRSNLVAE